MSDADSLFNTGVTVMIIVFFLGCGISIYYECKKRRKYDAQFEGTTPEVLTNNNTDINTNVVLSAGYTPYNPNTPTYTPVDSAADAFIPQTSNHEVKIF